MHGALTGARSRVAQDEAPGSGGRPRPYTPADPSSIRLQPDPGAPMHPLRPALLGLACCVVATGLATADSGRLSRDVVPTAESVRLVVDAAKPGYTATVRLDVRGSTATDPLQL